MILVPGWDYLGPPDSNYSGPMQRVMGLVEHIAQGSFWGTVGWQQNPVSDVSSHTVHGKAGERAQMLSLDLTAWTQAAGNGLWISVENEGFNYEALTAGQLESSAQLYAFLVQRYGVPLQMTDSPNVPGLGWHGMGGAAWGNHPTCPGEPIKSQRPAILARAQEILTGGPPVTSSGGADMLIAKSGAGPSGEDTDHSRWWCGTGVHFVEITKAEAETRIHALRNFYGAPNATILTWGDSSPEAVQRNIGPVAAGTAPGGGPVPLTYDQTVQAARDGANQAEDS